MHEKKQVIHLGQRGQGKFYNKPNSCPKSAIHIRNVLLLYVAIQTDVDVVRGVQMNSGIQHL